MASLAHGAARKDFEEERQEPVVAVLDQLRPLLPVLAGIAHRNRNQHGGARWWAEFGMLRRQVGRVVGELEGGYDGGDDKERELERKRKRKREGSAGRTRRRTGMSEDALARMVWLRDVMIVRCYLAFSQLAADNQFATLGVVLLAVLAQVRKACVGVVGGQTAAARAAAPLARGTGLSSAVDIAHDDEDALDLGQVISRQDLESSAPPKEEHPPSSSSAERIKAKQSSHDDSSHDEVTRAPRRRATDPPPPPLEVVTIPSTARKDKTKDARAGKQEKASGGTTITTMMKEMGGGKPKSGDDKKKKKKKKKGGDEFDDLFSSLF